MPQFSIHRGRLHALLWQTARERLGDARVIPDRRLTGIAQNGDAVTATFTDATGQRHIHTGHALIGADGIHSWLRAQLHPSDGGIRWNGIQMWRGATDWPAFDGGDAMVIAGDTEAKLVLYPIAPGQTPATRLTNWVIYARTGDPGAPPPGRENWSRRGRPADFAHLVRRIRLPFIDAAALIDATPDIFEYPMCDRDPLPWWTQGRVTLMGDAAHPMYPVGSNGASQAVLDARCLARQLALLPAPEALAAYDSERRPATSAIVAANRNGGPERVIDMAGHATQAEIEAVARGYATLAGFEVRK